MANLFGIPSYVAPNNSSRANLMPTNQQIKQAIDLLSTVEDNQISQMEAEFSFAYHKFSGIYENHLSKQIAKDSAIDWLLATKVPCCPVCSENDKVSIVCPQNEEREYFGSYVGTDRICFSADSCDYSGLDKELVKYIELNAPHLAYTVNNHLFCERCRKSFDGAEFIKEFWSLESPFKTITDWVAAGKPGLRYPPEKAKLDRDQNGEIVYNLEDDELPF